MYFILGVKPIHDSALIEHLERARMEFARTQSNAVFGHPAFDDDDVHA